MRILITGASGFIGSYLAERLIARREHKVALLVRQTSTINISRIQGLAAQGALVYYAGLGDMYAVGFAISDFQPEVVCHLGALTPVAKSFDNIMGYVESNVVGGTGLLENIRRHAPGLRRFIFASSTEVYGRIHSKKILELSRLSPKGYAASSGLPPPLVEEDFDIRNVGSPYATTKVQQEALLNSLHYSYGFPFVTFRQTNCFGRRDSDYFVTERMIVQMLKEKEIRLGDPRPVRNFIFIRDLLDVWERVITWPKDDIHGEVFNLGPSNGLSIGTLAEKIAELLRWKGRIHWNTMPRRPGEIFYLNTSCAKVEKTIGWRPKTSLEAGLKETIAQWKKNLGVR